MRVEKLPIEYYVHYLGNETNCPPNLSVMQYTHVTNLHMYPPHPECKVKVEIIYLK